MTKPKLTRHPVPTPDEEAPHGGAAEDIEDAAAAEDTKWTDAMTRRGQLNAHALGAGTLETAKWLFGAIIKEVRQELAALPDEPKGDESLGAIVLPPWSNTSCTQCGTVFGVTRSESKTVLPGARLWCPECRDMERGFREGADNALDRVAAAFARFEKGATAGAGGAGGEGGAEATLVKVLMLCVYKNHEALPAEAWREEVLAIAKRDAETAAASMLSAGLSSRVQTVSVRDLLAASMSEEDVNDLFDSWRAVLAPDT